MEKSINIIPPEGYEIDKEKSTFEKIVFKKKNSDINNSDKQVLGYYYSYISQAIMETKPYPLKDYSLTKYFSASEKVARSNTAKNRISYILKYDERFGGEITYEEWRNRNIEKHVIIRACDKIDTYCNCITYNYLAFHTAEQRDLFLKEYEGLIKDYLML